MNIEKIYSNRFNEDELRRKALIWKILVKDFFQKYVAKTDVVLDIAAGECEFINNINCQEKHALDLNPSIIGKVGQEVNSHIGSCTDLTIFQENHFDVIFASNIFEHLNQKKEVTKTLRQIRRVLKEEGKLLILQPNIRYAYKEYWDFFDHNIPLSHVSMLEALAEAGFEATELRPKFLPYSTKNHPPFSAFLLRFYLRSGFLQSLFGKQMFIVAKKADIFE